MTTGEIVIAIAERKEEIKALLRELFITQRKKLKLYKELSKSVEESENERLH